MLNRGEIILDGTMDELKNKFGEQILIKFRKDNKIHSVKVEKNKIGEYADKIPDGAEIISIKQEFDFEDIFEKIVADKDWN